MYWAKVVCMISGLLAYLWSAVVTNTICQVVPALSTPSTLLDCISKSTWFCVDPISPTSSSQWIVRKMAYVVTWVEHLIAGTKPSRVLFSSDTYQKHSRWWLFCQPGCWMTMINRVLLLICYGHLTRAENKPLLFLSHWDLGIAC